MFLLLLLASVILVGKTRSKRALSGFYEQKARLLVAEKNALSKDESAETIDSESARKKTNGPR